jgi:hypothetical protein
MHSKKKKDATILSSFSHILQEYSLQHYFGCIIVDSPEVFHEIVFQAS